MVVTPLTSQLQTQDSNQNVAHDLLILLSMLNNQPYLHLFDNTAVAIIGPIFQVTMASLRYNAWKIANNA